MEAVYYDKAIQRFNTFLPSLDMFMFCCVQYKQTTSLVSIPFKSQKHSKTLNHIPQHAVLQSSNNFKFYRVFEHLACENLVQFLWRFYNCINRN